MWLTTLTASPVFIQFILKFQQSKTPNGKVRKGQRYEDAFDVTRSDEADVTLETVLDPDTSASTTYHLLDTSRRPEFDGPDIPANDSFNKLPDDNMNSEVRRGHIPLANSKVLPTLQPNGWPRLPASSPELH